jgi:hypothetical protein
MDKSTRGAAGITSLQAGEDVKCAGALPRLHSGRAAYDLGKAINDAARRPL